MKVDVAVIGAGPGGAAAALAHARAGAKVALLEANPERATRFAGELLHPGGVRTLQELGVQLLSEGKAPPVCQGFAVFPDGENPPIELTYPRGDAGLTMPHEGLVAAVRSAAMAHPNVEYLPHAKCLEVDEQRMRIVRGLEPESWLEADRIVVAVGRSSPLSERPATGHRRKLLSQMAVLVLRDVELPQESFGHLLLGGPGPVLMYRIGDSQVRVCIDVSLDAMSRTDQTADLWQHYRDAFPAALREPVEREFLAGRVTFMSNQLAQRTWYGRPGCTMIGDAVGYFHPLTAIGITLAVEDAACLACCPEFAQFRTQRFRQSKVAVLLATALYEIFSNRSEAASACRSSIFQLWRDSPAERIRTMDLLSGSDTNLWSLYRSAGKVFGLAMKDVLASAHRRRWSSSLATVHDISHLANWMLSGAVPECVRSRLPSGRVTPFESSSKRRNSSPAVPISISR